MSRGNAVRLVTSGVPRLYAAARSAGCDHVAALDCVRVSATVFVRAARAEPTRLRVQNALRHFVWQALLTARHGKEVAQALATAQEQGSSDAEDSRVDALNNAVGQEYGAAHAGELAHLGLSAALDRLLATGHEKWESRELGSVPLADGTDPRDVVEEPPRRRRRRKPQGRSQRSS